MTNMSLFGGHEQNGHASSKFTSPSWTSSINNNSSSSCMSNGCNKRREERKRFIKMLDSKYRLISDSEICMRKYVLIRTNIIRLQKELKEETMALRETLTMEENLFRNLGLHIEEPTPSLPQDDFECPPQKRLKLMPDCDKENETTESSEPIMNKLPDEETIFRELCETYSRDVHRPSVLNDSFNYNNSNNENFNNCNIENVNSTSNNENVNNTSNNLNQNSSEMEWSVSCQVKCGSPFIINDYRGIASRSLLMPIES